MPSVNLVIESKLSRSVRVRQLEAMFDVPASEVVKLEWHGELPIEEQDWNVGLIVGPSGSGKTQIVRKLFGTPVEKTWKKDAVIDDFAAAHSMQDIAAVCQAVGFNTIPAWMRPYKVLSNGEKFRVELARHMLEDKSPIVVDEFTSVVDRQVAKIASHAVQKHIRKIGKKFIAVSCHYDVIDWLQPDWIFEPATMFFSRRLLHPRPKLEVEIARVDYKAWELFAPFHYLTKELNHAAACFVLFVGGRPTSFGGVLHRPHATARNIVGLSRLVTLPDWQGLGLALILSERLGAAYKSKGKRLHTYPAHPSLIRSYAKQSETWALHKRAGVFSPSKGASSSVGGKFGGRACAVYEYKGAAMELKDAEQLLGA
jgi:ABC-type lipoprotein export system ATPase subunit